MTKFFTRLNLEQLQMTKNPTEKLNFFRKVMKEWEKKVENAGIQAFSTFRTIFSKRLHFQVH